MRIRIQITCLFALLIGGAGWAADDARQATSQNAQAAVENSAPLDPRKECVKQCEQNNGICNTDVRASKRDCEKLAANRGNNPFLGRPDYYDGYCGYFGSDHCGYFSNRGVCRNRYARRYAECVEWMRGNIASQRYECYKAENKAQSLCRAELRDCRAQCQ